MCSPVGDCEWAGRGGKLEDISLASRCHCHRIPLSRYFLFHMIPFQVVFSHARTFRFPFSFSIVFRCYYFSLGLRPTGSLTRLTHSHTPDETGTKPVSHKENETSLELVSQSLCVLYTWGVESYICPGVYHRTSKRSCESSPLVPSFPPMPLDSCCKRVARSFPRKLS